VAQLLQATDESGRTGTYPVVWSVNRCAGRTAKESRLRTADEGCKLRQAWHIFGAAVKYRL
jgi:hypothetical protein